MKIVTDALIAGARRAEGTVVIIDVFRAFTLEPFVLAGGAASLTAVGEADAAWSLRKEDPSVILIGERHGRRIEGFDYGNSPAAAASNDFRGRRVVHTTSAGTQGLANAVNAQHLLAASLVNASATATWIRRQNPAVVTLVCMGWEGKRNTEEDQLCADYIRSLLEGCGMSDIRKQAEALRCSEGKKFFDPAQAEVFPEADFWLCTDVDRFSFAVRAEKEASGFRMEAVQV